MVMQPSACYMSYFYQVKNYLKNYPKLIGLSRLIEIPSHVLTPAVHAVESERISIRWTILGILRDFTYLPAPDYPTIRFKIADIFC